MTERLNAEMELIQKEYGEIELAPNLDWFIVKKFPLPPGWNKDHTAVLILIPSGYPVTPPDNFYTDNDLRLLNGGMPGAATENQQHQEKPWLQFSYHFEEGEWNPKADISNGDNFLTFLVVGVTKRLSEVS